jgi:hypothetical protein
MKQNIPPITMPAIVPSDKSVEIKNNYTFKNSKGYIFNI